MKAAIYCRLSREDDNRTRESESIRNQRALLLAWCREQGAAVEEIYTDEDYSGADRDRPDFNRLLRDASARRFDLIVCKSQSRFSRDMELVEHYLHGLFPEWGIRFVSLVDGADTADSTNKRTRQLNGLINEWYLDDCSRSVRAVLDDKRRRGEYIASHALYGYSKAPQNHNKLIIDPEAAAVVKRIYRLYLAGYGMGRIAKILNGENLPNPTAYKRGKGEKVGVCGSLWSKSTVRNILSNRTYVGDMVSGRNEKISYKTKKMRRLPKDCWIVAPHTHEGIVSEEEYRRVQALRRQKQSR